MEKKYDRIIDKILHLGEDDENEINTLFNEIKELPYSDGLNSPTKPFLLTNF